jgi:RimJ/RimL family protein N-acetyltransferase
MMNTELNLQPENLANKYVKLLPLSNTDFERLYAVASDPLLWEQHPAKDRYKREVFRKFFDEGIESKGAFIILDAETNEPIGTSRFYDYDEKRKSIAVGYTFLARKYWGGNYNKASKELMLNYIFNFVETVIFHIGKDNIRSQIATGKFGAKLNRDLTDAEEKENTLVFELKKSDWMK